MVVDPVGGDLAEPALRSLHYGGRFVTVGYASGEVPRIPLNLVLLKGITIRASSSSTSSATRPTSGPATRPSCWSCSPTAGRSPTSGAAFPLEQTSAALRLVADGQAVGKVVIEI